MPHAPKDIPASIRQRLRNRVAGTGRTFGELLQHFAIERFLYRLSCTRHSDRFILKGALMLTVWQDTPSRTTMDIDLLGRADNDIATIAAMVRDACLQEVEPDGMTFDADSIEGETINEEAEYPGVRIKLRGNLGTARVAIRLDVGFGDPVVPGPQLVEFPTLLDLPAPRLRGYSRESAIAEKFEAMVRRGTVNSRLKDFFDVWTLSRQLDFDGTTLGTAITRTFADRGTDIPLEPIALTRAFAEDPAKTAQWRGFLRKARLQSTSETFPEVVEAIAVFLGPIASRLAVGEPFEGTWNAPGPWLAETAETNEV